MQAISSLIRLLLFIALPAALIGCQSTPVGSGGPGVAAVPARRAAEAGQTFAAGDVVRLQFVGAPDMNQTQRVRADGRITAPMVGEVEVVGRRPAVVQNQLASLYKPKLQNAEVYVSIESSTVPVYVSGAVNRPGKVLLERRLTALEAIMEAGGFARGLADPRKVRIIRQAGGKHQTTTIDLTRAMRGETVEAVYVQPYDVIVVPETWL